MAAERILIVDDEPGVRGALEGILSDEGFATESAESGELGLEACTASRYDAILLDVWLPGIDGLQTLKNIRERNVDAAVVMISGHGTIETAVRATKLGAFDFIEKPLSLERTLLVLRNALRQRRLERTNHRLLEALTRDTEIVGESAAARSVRTQLELASGSDAPVLIRGERGTGRESMARRIHSSGKAPDAPFVDLRCDALDGQAAEAALFGESGRPGRIRLASGGTLFLEDLDRLPLESQARLAAALAGGSGVARLIGSVLPGGEDLDPRLRTQLDVIRVDAPALRERREDIEMLAERFVQDLSREYARKPPQLAPDCLDALRGHDWPGNVRELRNLIERLVLGGTDVVRAADLPAELGGHAARTPDLYGEFSSLEEGLRVFQRYQVLRAMNCEGENVGAAARRLGVSVTTLRRRLRELGS